jgi:DNA repair protein RadD
MNAPLFVEDVDLFDVSGINMPPLRAFQSEAIKALQQAIREGHKKILVCACTGAGKTVLSLEIVRRSIAKKRRSVFTAERRTLVNQTSAAADSFGLVNHGVVMADHERRNNEMPFQIASLQTIAKRGYWPRYDILLVDECHVMLDVWVKEAQKTNAVVIGLTATPFAKGLGGVFTKVINAATMARLTEEKILVIPKIYSGTAPDMTGAAMHAGEWTDTSSGERGIQIVGEVVKEYQRLGEGRKTIAFCASIAHAKELAGKFNQADIGAAVFCAETLERDRVQILEEYRKPDSELRILVSVEALSRGFDVPDVGCVIDARPLKKSFSTFVQMLGRGLRSSPGKTDCIVLCHSGNYERFQEDFEELYHNGVDSLESGEKLDSTSRKEPEEKEPRACPECGYKPFVRQCLSCGFTMPKKSEVVEVQAQLSEVIMVGKGKSQMAIAMDHRHLWAQCCKHVHETGKKPGAAWHIYRKLNGDVSPPPGWHFVSGEDVEYDKNFLHQIKVMKNRWIYAQKANKSAKAGAPA